MSSMFYKLGSSNAITFLGLEPNQVKTAADLLWDQWTSIFEKIAAIHSLERFAQRTNLPRHLYEHVTSFLDSLNRHSMKLHALPEKAWLRMPDGSKAAISKVPSPAGGHRYVYNTHLAADMVPKGTEITKELLKKKLGG